MKQFKYCRAPTSPLPERITRRKSTIDKDEKEGTVEKPTIISLPTVTTTPCDNQQPTTSRTASHINVKHEITSPPSSSSSSTTSGAKLSTMSISPPKMSLLTDRRPSVGANVIPHAALCQHRHSLQINGDGGVYRVSDIYITFGL